MEIDLDAYREQSRETWARMASGWQDRRDWLMEITGGVNDWLVQKADPQPGQTILDIAAGMGDLGFHAAERVGHAGRVISTDFSPEMLERRPPLRRGPRPDERRVPRVGRRAHGPRRRQRGRRDLPFRLHADGRPGAALKETRRVLRDGGPLAFAVWRRPTATRGRPSPG